MNKIPKTLFRPLKPILSNTSCAPSNTTQSLSLSHAIDEIQKATNAFQQLQQSVQNTHNKLNKHKSITNDTTITSDDPNDTINSIQISRKGLFKTSHTHLTHEQRIKYKEQPMTPLASELHTLIRLRGPLTIYEYMTKCLSHVQHGYYTNKSNIISSTGDFITNPEISQIYGELVCIDCIDKLYKLQQQTSTEFDTIQLIELGPGNGTLLHDVLRAFKQFNNIYNKLQIHLVETSRIMRQKQCDLLGIQPHTIKYVSNDNNIYDSITPHTNSKTMKLYNQKSDIQSDKSTVYHELQDERVVASGTTSDGIDIIWYNDIRDVPAPLNIQSTCQFILAHEFLDALPVHQFQYTERGWCEVLVDIDEDITNKQYFRFVLSNSATPAVNTFLPNKLGYNNAELGERIEISPQQLAVTEDIVMRIGNGYGYCLLIDYGDYKQYGNSLQAVKQHHYVNVLSEPGNVDLTTLVNFKHITQIAQHTIKRFELNADVLPLITQHEYLRNLGIAPRINALLGNMSDEQLERDADTLIKSAERLVDMKQMGGLFKVLRLGSKQLILDELEHKPDKVSNDDDNNNSETSNQHTPTLTKQ